MCVCVCAVVCVRACAACEFIAVPIAAGQSLGPLCEKYTSLSCSDVVLTIYMFFTPFNFLTFFNFFPLSHSQEYETKVANFMATELPKSELVNNVDGAMFFKVPEADDETLVNFFKLVEERRNELGISDFSVGLTTLEEVFLELSKRDQFIVDDPSDPDAALKAASAEQVKTLDFQIPEGAEPGKHLKHLKHFWM